VKLSQEEARRVAVRAQLLDGGARDVLSTVRRLGFLQIDVVQPVAQPQHLVLFSRLGAAYDRTELERLLWQERALFEWGAFIWPLEDLPLVQARMRTMLDGERKWQVRIRDWLAENRSFRRYVVRELERRGPMPSRELEDRSVTPWRSMGGWTAGKNVTQMLEFLHAIGEVAVAGRVGPQRLWDVAERWYPQVEPVSLREAEAVQAERRLRSQGVRLVRGEWKAHPDAVDGVADGPVPDRAVLLSPFDRLVYDRNRTEALWGFRYRLEMFVPKAKREYGYYVLPLLVGDSLVGRAEPRFDRETRRLELLGAWGDTSRLDEALADLGRWLGADTIG
jgi:uncharacterized protein YcaQ